MEVRNLTKDEAVNIIDWAFKFLKDFKPQASRYNIGLDQEKVREQIDYVIDYKKQKALEMIEGLDTITINDVFMFISCPVDVDSREDITTFGLRLDEFPGNGRLNQSVANNILKYSIQYSDIKLAQSIPDDDRLRLITKDELLDHFSPQMLDNNALLLYLFMTGRGKDFTTLFDNTDLLKKIEDGTVTESEFEKACPTEQKSPQKELDSDYISFLYKDLQIIADKMGKKEEKVSNRANIYSKGV